MNQPSKIICLVSIILFQPLISNAQSTFKVENKIHHVYLYAPNPISYSRFGVAKENVRLKAINGTIDTIKQVIYWTPKSKNYEEPSSLLVEEFKDGIWVPIESIDAGRRRVLPHFFDTQPKPLGFHAYPNLMRFTSLQPILPYEFSHLPIDSLTRVLSFDVLFLDADRAVIDTLVDMNNAKAKLLSTEIKKTLEIKFVQFINIKIESKLWVGDDKFHTGKAKDGRVYSVR